MTYACLAWELVAELLKLQCLQNKVLRTIENFARWTLVHDLHMAFNLPYVYNYITKLSRQQAEVIQNHEIGYARSIAQDVARHKKYKTFEIGGSQAYDSSSD
jgi:hypothetical protein